MKFTAYIDGSSMGNPGDAGYGIILKNENGETIEALGQYIGVATNNIAEYSGLLNCLVLLHKYQGQKITVYSDSLLLVNQLKGNYKVKNERLKEMFRQIQEILRKGNIDLEMVHISRDRNHDADRLARRAVRLRKSIHECVYQSQG